jgi:small subunit ribosomal protein S6
MQNINRNYEIGFVIDPEATEEDVKKVIDSVVEIIKKANGNIENVDEWGRRRLAYPIKGHNEGIYIFITADVKGAVYFEIERRLKLSEKVMRFIINRLDDKMKKANRLTKKWKRMERLSKRTSEEDAIAVEISDEKEGDYE